MSRTVVISGAGPAGLMLAGELALAGVPAVVLERRPEPAGVSAGMAVHGRTLELFKRRGLRDAIRPEDIFPWPRTPFALLWLNMEGARDEDYTYAFPQWRTERLLEQWAVGLGVDLRRGHEVADLVQDDEGVTVGVTDERGGRYEVRGGWLAACDGADSRVRELAGIGSEQKGPGYYGVLGDLELTEGADRQFDAGVHPDGVFGAIPLSADTVRLMTLEFDVDAPGPQEPVTAEELAARIGRITGRAPKLGRLTWLSRFGGPTRLAERFRDGRVLLVGDAAHSMFVSGTHGLNAALHDAANLGWKLAAEINGWAPPGLLDSYQQERRAVADQLCRHANASMALLYPYKRVAALRELVDRLIGFDQVNRHLLEITTEARYPLPGDPQDHPLIGAPVPDATLALADGRSSVAEAMRGGRALLLDLSEGTAAVGDAAGWADRVDTVVAKAAPELPAAVVLVRPDGHIAYASNTGDDRAGLLSALRTWFGDPAVKAPRTITQDSYSS
jgi:2-polyprenyl-6-methoxyphenol hydroxylase-like FAD-dependent oxidoreductase